MPSRAQSACFADERKDKLAAACMDAPASGDTLLRLRQIVAALRGPEGCPWDREQTHASLRGHLLEEAYETVEAIEREDTPHFCEELGDLLLQVVLHAQIAEDAGDFDLDQVARSIADKLIRRHPHVFGDSSVKTTAGVLVQWDEIKRQEKGYTTESLLEGVSSALPALMRAQKIQKRAAQVGFDWPTSAEVLAKVREETAEIAEALAAHAPAAVADEIGDLLFTAVNLARREGLDAEVTLAAATAKFARRFQAMERAARERGDQFADLSLAEQETLWQTAKTQEA